MWAGVDSVAGGRLLSDPQAICLALPSPDPIFPLG